MYKPIKHTHKKIQVARSLKPTGAIDTTRSVTGIPEIPHAIIYK